MTIADELRPQVRIGNEAGWLLTFDRDSGPPPLQGYPAIGSDRFYADIRATLPSGLEGGSYSFVVEGLPDNVHAQLSQGRDDSPEIVRLHLFWHEQLAGITGYARNLVGLTRSASAIRPADVPGGPVAVLSIVEVSRRAGARHYETVITAREQVFESTARVLLCGRGIVADDPRLALDALVRRLPAARRLVFHGLDPGPDAPPGPPADGGGSVLLEAGRPLAELLGTLATAMERRTNRHGRGMLLIRDGTLHLGTRPVPFERVSLLHAFNGLLQVEALAPVPTDPSFDRCSSPGKPPERRQFRLTLKGRPDLKPGDVVVFVAPATESSSSPRPTGLVGDLLGAPLSPQAEETGDGSGVRLYVHAVEHALSRTAGFTTVLSGVELTAGRDDWDSHTPSRATPEPERVSADPVTDAARAVRGLADRVVASRRLADVGEVRSATASGTGEPPGQTELVWRGLVPPDGHAHGARRLAIDRETPSPVEGVAVTSPFAWGRCGLVLPRYPGTRVLLVHRDGESDDPIEVGALWAPGSGPDAEPGDWWLALPAEVPAADRASIPDASVPGDYTGKATNDLIDADGNRRIEVGKLVVRVGRDGLTKAGSRPAPAADDGADVSIEHADGATRIVVRANGEVEIRAARKLSLTVDDGPIELSANSVAVKVDGAMDVTRR
jgi:hypothetical protein